MGYILFIIIFLCLIAIDVRLKKQLDNQERIIARLDLVINKDKRELDQDE